MSDSRRMFLAMACALCAVQISDQRLSAAEINPGARPNLVAIVTDDQARWAMGLYGNKQIRTPNMDRIGKEGALFRNAFVVTPVCSPSRASYFSGRWPTQVGITDYLSPDESRAGLGLGALIWPQVLRDNGYRTALIGKWHLGSKPQFHPTQKGFDLFCGFLVGGAKPMDPIVEIGGKDRQLQGPLPDLLTDRALEFIRENRAHPFALCLHFREPHLPYTPVSEIDSAPYRDIDPDVPTPRGGDARQIKQWHREYYASISAADRNIGRVLAELDKLGLAANTLVIFTSDHGYNNGRHGVETKGNGRWILGGVRGPTRPNMWDTSIRVPLVARWPAVIKPGSTYEDVVSHLDMFRSVLGALGIDVPKHIEKEADGIDFSPLFRGATIPRREALYGQYDLHNGGLAYMRMIRTDRYKYVRFYKAQGLDELYDLSADPDEEDDLLKGRDRETRQPVVDELAKKLVRWQESIDDPVLNSTY